MALLKQPTLFTGSSLNGPKKRQPRSLHNYCFASQPHRLESYLYTQTPDSRLHPPTQHSFGLASAMADVQYLSNQLEGVSVQDENYDTHAPPVPLKAKVC